MRDLDQISTVCRLKSDPIDYLLCDIYEALKYALIAIYQKFSYDHSMWLGNGRPELEDWIDILLNTHLYYPL